MAIDFDGANTRFLTALASDATIRSYSIWAYRDTTGEGGLGRIFDRANNSAGAMEQLYVLSGGDYSYERVWSGAASEWVKVAPATGSWHHVLITYDGSSTANNASIYYNGTLQTSLTTYLVPPSGSLVTSTQPFNVGNRADSARTWDGRLAEFAVWDRLLDSTDASNLAAGRNPLTVGSTGRACYYRMFDTDDLTDLFGKVGAATLTVGAGGTIGHPTVDDPFIVNPGPPVFVPMKEMSRA